jgi:hypothetical protein
MASGIAAHLRDLEHEARDAEKDYEDFQDFVQQRTEAWNIEIHELVHRVQRDKATLKEKLEKKQLFAQRKLDEVQIFRVRNIQLMLSCYMQLNSDN